MPQLPRVASRQFCSGLSFYNFDAPPMAEAECFEQQRSIQHHAAPPISGSSIS